MHRPLSYGFIILLGNRQREPLSFSSYPRQVEQSARQACPRHFLSVFPLIYNLYYPLKSGLLHVGQRTYSDYESGKTRIPVDNLLKLAKFYNISMDYITGASNIKTEYRPYKKLLPAHCMVFGKESFCTFVTDAPEKCPFIVTGALSLQFLLYR